MDSTLACARTSSASAAAVAPSRRVALIAALLASAVVLGLVESTLPSVALVPWLRIGLANLAVVIALVCFGVRAAGLVSLGRVVIVAVATGTLWSPVFAMSVGGAVASLVVMAALSATLRGITPVGVSAAGSAAHVLAQFVVASVLVDTPSLLVLAPPSVLAALALGAVIGLIAQAVVSRMPWR